MRPLDHWLGWLSGCVLWLLLAAPLVGAADAGGDLVRPRAIVLHVHAQIEDQGFLPELIRRLEQSLAPPIVARATDFDLGPLRAASDPLDGQALVDAVVRAIDWGASGGTVQVLLIKDDLRLPPARYNFAVSHGSATSPQRVIVVSLARLQGRRPWGGPDLAPWQTAERIAKLVLKNTARVCGYGGSTRCIFGFPRHLGELDALPEGYCEPDLAALIGAWIARPIP